MADRRMWLLGAVIAVGVIAIALVVTGAGTPTPTRGYTEFLDAAAGGRVQSVTQQGSTLLVEGTDGRYEVNVPSILTDVWGDIQAATGAEGQVPVFSAIPTADTDRGSMFPMVGTTAALVIAMVALVVALSGRRRPSQPT